MPKNSEGGFNLPEGTEELTAHLAEMSDAELSGLLTKLGEAFDKQYGDGTGLTDEALAELEKLGKQITAAQDISTTRETEREERDRRGAELRNSIRPAADAAANADDGDEDGEDGNADDSADAEKGELVAATSDTAIVAAMQAMTDTAATMKSFAADWIKPDGDLNRRLRLGEIAKYAPNAGVHEERSEAVIVASADVPGFTQGGRVESIYDLAKAMHSRARMLPVSKTGNPNIYPVAALQREFTFTLNENATPKQINEVLTAATDIDILTAAGGWCAPSEISYDFFNIVCEDGMIDLPTVGLNRGGVQYPTSPSFGDLVSIPDIVWSWTEQDDIDALTSDSVFKPCVRVECPSFVDRRADCFGFCVTAGNLVDYAYPELIANWLRLVFAIRAKATNAAIIDIMLNGGGSGDAITPSIAVDHTGLLGATTSALLQSIELSIVDYREKFSMCSDAVLEVVLPRWANAVIRADLANRDGIDVFSVSNGMIADWFNLRGARVQFVGDWQVREAGEPGTATPGGATPLETWPDTIDYMVFAPGTFVRGNSMSLDLGVTRDSVLNATNDHTAAWAEDCFAILKPGHESRVVTVALCPSGEIGERSITCAAA
jgi:hypothetical protein